MGLSSALSIAGRALDVFSTGIQVAGNNVANSSSPDFIREQLVIQPGPSSRQGNLSLGSGAFAAGIRQQIDKFLERRLYLANADARGASVISTAWQQLETSLDSLGGSSLTSEWNAFVGTLNDLANQAELPAARRLVIEQGVRFAQVVTGLRSRLDQFRAEATARAADLVREANRLIDQIAELNPKIVSQEVGGLSGSDASGLRTERYKALARLSELLPIRAIETDSGRIDVYMGTYELVIPGRTQHLATFSHEDRGVIINQVRIEGSVDNLTGTQGEILGTLHGREAVIGAFIDKLDQFAANLIYEFNKVHASGTGSIGFQSVVADYAASSATAPLDAAGLTFTPRHGAFQIMVRDANSGARHTATIEVDLDGTGTKTTLADLAARIDALANVQAAITGDHKLTIAAASGYELYFGEDTSGILAALGINAFFSGGSSRDMAVHQRLRDDARWLATGQGGGPADGRNALALAAIGDQPLANLGNESLLGFYQATLAGATTAAATAQSAMKGFEGFRASLWNQRVQTTGVSLDEETLLIMQFQRAYQMAARFISTIDQLFNVLLQV